MLKLALKASPSASSDAANKTALFTDATIVASQSSAISQLTEQVFQVKLKKAAAGQI